ncbi:N-acetylmuramoyl-L-alanine amidase [Nocardioides euryhalodurans]|uniref:N-acetylmuramoyl-L-alanine amidase n=1 Tax=Nocardioides euryhalodurans TaxID=2518370 RepID=A0A4P7GMM6_9ACTN|nr:N-acetylmuramoyl-L-alanine amidase [Nocardioides euryhalodurans]QBR93396.1 hypothetical protein EXE57_14810 [Nocardioides euryhalodurans]
MTKSSPVPDLSGRRPLLKAAAGGLVALGAVGVASRVALHPGDDPDPGADGPPLLLSAQGDSDVRALDLRLGDELLPRVGKGRWETRRLPTSTHSMVGFTWPEEAPAPTIRIRSRVAGAWQPWQPVPRLHDAPDPDSGEGNAVTGTDLVWIGASDGIQIQVEGSRPGGLTLVLLHPARRALDTQAAPLARGLAAAEAETAERRVPMPTMFSRADWGADERWRSGTPTINRTIKQVHVHHTVNANNYSRGDVAGLVRGMYRYHTQNLGWSDLGYNFLVDRFGRIWVGRAGGPQRPVRGAHTLGFNHESTGISVIGNFEVATPSSATLTAVAAIAAWKLHPYGRKPRGRISVRSEGSDRFPSGRTVSLPVIDGHRDTNETACPGRHLYAQLPAVRRRAARQIRRAGGSEPATITVTEPAAITGTALLGRVLRGDPGRFTPGDASVSWRWLRNGKPIPGAGAKVETYRARARDIGQRVSCRVTLAKDGLPTVTQTTSAVDVGARAQIVTDVTSRRGRVTVRVTVEGPDGVRRRPSGKVTVTLGRADRTLTLSRGAAATTIGRHRRVRAGTHTLTVTYAGGGGFEAPRVTRTITVPR